QRAAKLRGAFFGRRLVGGAGRRRHASRVFPTCTLLVRSRASPRSMGRLNVSRALGGPGTPSLRSLRAVRWEPTRRRGPRDRAAFASAVRDQREESGGARENVPMERRLAAFPPAPHVTRTAE